jgi:histidinol-phosphate aminotransferase
MDMTRRALIAGASASTAFLGLTGFTGELRASMAAGLGTNPTNATKARILFNENPLGPSPLALKVIESSASYFGRYPLSEGPRLEMKLRKLHRMPYEEIGSELSLKPRQPLEGNTDLLLGVGSSEILKAIAWAYCSQSGNIVEAHPSYSAAGDSAESIPGSSIVRKIVPLNAVNQLDVPAMIRAIDDQTRLVVVCNPNNPTGTTISLSQIEAMAQATPENALLLVDEAYIEFLPDGEKGSAVELAKSRKNVLVARTFSKIYGLAGMRVGYGLGPTEVIAKLKPYMLGRLSMSMAGVLAAEASLDDQSHIEKTRHLQRKSSEIWKTAAQTMGWKSTKSDVGFCWMDLGRDATPLIQFLAERNVLISGGARWNLPNCVRISMGSEEENDMLISGLRAFAKA